MYCRCTGGGRDFVPFLVCMRVCVCMGLCVHCGLREKECENKMKC